MYFKYCAESPSVSEYVGLEPVHELHAEIHKSINKYSDQIRFPSRILGCFIEDISPSENGTYDSVILGNVLCEVPDEVTTLYHVKRLLKKGGRCYFSEHVMDRDQKWRAITQMIVAPWWRTVSGGCNVTRHQLDHIVNAFGQDNICHWTLYAGSFPWTARFEIGLALCT